MSESVTPLYKMHGYSPPVLPDLEAVAPRTLLYEVRLRTHVIPHHEVSASGVVRSSTVRVHVSITFGEVLEF